MRTIANARIQRSASGSCFVQVFSEDTPESETAPQEPTLRDVLDAVAGLSDKLAAFQKAPDVTSARASQVDEFSSLPAKISALSEQVAALSTLSERVTARSAQAAAFSSLPDQMSALSKKLAVLSSLPDKVAALSVTLAELSLHPNQLAALSSLSAYPKKASVLPDEATAMPVHALARKGTVPVYQEPVAAAGEATGSLQTLAASARVSSKATAPSAPPEHVHALAEAALTVPANVPVPPEGAAKTSPHADEAPCSLFSLAAQSRLSGKATLLPEIVYVAPSRVKARDTMKVRLNKSPVQLAGARDRRHEPGLRSEADHTRLGIKNVLDLLRAAVPRDCLLPGERHSGPAGLPPDVDLLEWSRATAVANMLLVSAPGPCAASPAPQARTRVCSQSLRPILPEACRCLESVIADKRTSMDTSGLTAILQETRAGLKLWDAAAWRSAEEARNLVVSQPGLAVAVLTAATSDWDVCATRRRVR